MEIICTYADKNYLPQLISLIDSLVDNSGLKFKIYVLCLDTTVAEILQSLNYSQLEIIGHEQFLNENPNQKIALKNRKLINYYYTCTPVLIKHIFKLNNQIARVTYLDADMFCFNNFGEYFSEIDKKDVSIIQHTKFHDFPLIHGKYNVCILTFTNKSNARDCLDWWEKKTFESTEFNERVWGDQKYLDEFPKRFNKVHVVQHNGVGGAPWNINYYSISKIGKNILINNDKLIIYHFARVLILNRFFFIPARRSNINSIAIRVIYKEYFNSLSSSVEKIKRVYPDFKIRYTKHNFMGLILSLISGRVFYCNKNSIYRFGVNIRIFYEES